MNNNNASQGCPAGYFPAPPSAPQAYPPHAYPPTGQYVAYGATGAAPVVGVPISQHYYPQQQYYPPVDQQQQQQQQQQQYYYSAAPTPLPSVGSGGIAAIVPTAVATPRGPQRLRRGVALSLSIASGVLVVLCLAGLAAPFLTFYSSSPRTGGNFAMDVTLFRYATRDSLIEGKAPGSVFSGTIDDILCDDLYNPIVFARASSLQAFVLSVAYAVLNLVRLVSPVGKGTGPIILFTLGTCALICMICEANAASTFNYNRPNPSDGSLDPFDPKVAHCPMYNLFTGTLQGGWGVMVAAMVASAILFISELVTMCCGTAAYLPPSIEAIAESAGLTSWQASIAAGSGSSGAAHHPSFRAALLSNGAKLWLLALSGCGVILSIVGLSSTVISASSDSLLLTNSPMTLEMNLWHYTFASRASSVSSPINTLACNNPLLSNLQAARISLLFALLATGAYTALQLSRLLRPSQNLHKVLGVVATMAWGLCLLVAICCEGVARANPGGDGTPPFIAFDPEKTPCSYLNLFYKKDGPGLVSNFVGLLLAWLAFMSEIGIL